MDRLGCYTLDPETCTFCDRDLECEHDKGSPWTCTECFEDIESRALACLRIEHQPVSAQRLFQHLFDEGSTVASFGPSFFESVDCRFIHPVEWTIECYVHPLLAVSWAAITRVLRASLRVYLTPSGTIRNSMAFIAECLYKQPIGVYPIQSIVLSLEATALVSPDHRDHATIVALFKKYLRSRECKILTLVEPDKVRQKTPYSVAQKPHVVDAVSKAMPGGILLSDMLKEDESVFLWVKDLIADGIITLTSQNRLYLSAPCEIIPYMKASASPHIG